MAGAKIGFGSGITELTADAAGNAKTTLPTNTDYSGFAATVSEVDAGDVTGIRLMREEEVSTDFRKRIGVDTPIFLLSFEGTIVPQKHIQLNLTTMTAPMSGGFLQLNAGNSVTSGNAANVKTYRTFTLPAASGLYFDIWAREANETATGAVSEWGAGYVAGTSAPTDGIMFRRMSGGQLLAVVNYGGAETTANITTTNVPNRDGTGAYSATEVQHFLAHQHNDEVLFWINDKLVANIPTPSTQSGPTQCSTLPMFGRVYNSGPASAARRLEIGLIACTSADVSLSKPFPFRAAGNNNGMYIAQAGTTSGQTALYSPTAIAAPTWTANTAPATNALGGQWISPVPLPAGTSGLATIAETHYPIFAWLNPAGTATVPGRTAYLTGVRIGETFVTTVLGATPTVIQWGVKVGSTASSLATVDGAATVGPAGVIIGSQTFAVTAAVGTVAGAIDISFGNAPMIIPPGCYLHIIASLFLNAATGSLHGSATPIGIFE